MIREATLRDLPEIQNLCHMYYCETIVQRLEYSEEKMRNSLYNAIIEEDRDLSVLVVDDKIVGYTHANITDTLFSYDTVVDCDLLYVHPEYRKGNNGVKLIRNLTKIGKKHDAKYVYLGISSKINEERTVKLYNKLGYKQIGYDFRLEV